MSQPPHCEPTADGQATLLSLRAQPGARREGLVGAWNGMLKLATSTPPEDGRANERLVELVAELFGLSKSAVRLEAGAKARVKRLRLEAPTAAVRARLTQLFANEGGVA